MRADDLIIAVQKKREAMQRDIFAKPPQNYEDFLKRMGVWIGFGEMLNIIEDARKAEYDDE